MTQLQTPAPAAAEPRGRAITSASPRVRKRRQGVDPLALPETVSRKNIDYGVIATFAAVHLLALAVLVPWLFTWSGMLLAFATLYLVGCWGINICYHRLLTHRSFTTPRWFERVLTCLSFCNLEGSSVRWVATHRMHHQHSDHQPDPHSPLVDFLWAHVGWMVLRNSNIEDDEVLNRYARDLAKDRFHASMHRHNKWLLIWLAHAGLLFAGGWAVGHAMGGHWVEGLRVGLSWLFWGVFLRTVIIWHVTWSINSITHLWGYQTYKTTDSSRNNWLLGYLGMGEGWHNNHHADQRSARAGHRWWELDMSYLTIRLFGLLGLARNIVTPARNRGGTHDVRRKSLKR